MKKKHSVHVYDQTKKILEQLTKDHTTSESLITETAIWLFYKLSGREQSIDLRFFANYLEPETVVKILEGDIDIFEQEAKVVECTPNSYVILKLKNDKLIAVPRKNVKEV